MAGIRLHADFNHTQLRDALSGIARAVHSPAAILRAIGTGLAENVRHRIDRGVDPKGHPWQALSRAYARLKKGPGILRESLMLQRSITFQVAPNQVTVGSNRAYAAIHQFGGTIAHGGGTKFIRDAVVGKGKHQRLAVRFVKASFVGSTELTRAHQITMPARPYLGLGREDIETIDDVVWALIRKRLA